jgi:hypothetical protein
MKVKGDGQRETKGQWKETERKTYATGVGKIYTKTDP